MNKRIIELAKEADILEWEVLPWNKDARTPNHENAVKVTKFAELIVRELVSKLEVDGCEFYYNESNNWGCITVKYFVGGDPDRMRGEEKQAKFWGGEVRGTGYYHLNEQFVQHLMEQHFGVE